jgi:4-amino-4-deoxy-L-arabinose transferase-like glycosyltransferase
MNTNVHEQEQGDGKQMSYRITLKHPAFRKAGLLVIPAALATSAVYAHLQIMRARIDYRGPLVLLDHTFDLVLAVAVIVIAFCVGRGVCRVLKLDFVSRAEEVAYPVMLGVGALGLGLLGLGLAGWLRPLPVVLFFAAVTAITHRELIRLYDLSRDYLRSLYAAPERVVCSAAFAIVVTLFILWAATPPYSPDEAIYHLPVTQAFVERGRVFPLTDNFSGNLPFLIHMLYAVCLMAKTDIAAKLLSLLRAAISAFGLYAFCARFLSRRAGALALFAFFAAGMVVEIAVTTRIDVTLAGMIFMATGALITYLETSERGWLVASALLAGFSLGIKYSAGIWLLLIGVMFCVERLRKRIPLAAIARDGLLFIAVALAASAPWFVKNAVWFHNPVYPFFTGEVAGFENGSPRYFTAEDERKIAAHFEQARKENPEAVDAIEKSMAAYAARRPERHPLRFWEYFTRPNNYHEADPRLTPNYLFLCVPLLLLARRSKWVIWLIIISAGFFLLTVWAVWVARYLLPLYPALTVAAAYALEGVSERIEKYFRPGRLLAVVVVLSALGIGLVQSERELVAKRAWPFVNGTLSRQEFLTLARGDYRMLNFVNWQLPRGGRVLMIGAQLSYGLNHPHISDPGWMSVEWRRLLSRHTSLEEVHQALKNEGAQYVIYYPNLFGFVAYTGAEGSGPSGDVSLGKKSMNGEPDYLPQLQNWATFEAYSRKHLELVYGNDSMFGFKVFRLR